MHQHRIPARFIPTGVGNTHRQQHGRACDAVHPHGRGEHRTGFDIMCSRIGSSPRAWGTHGRHEPPTSPDRFIPTGVGNTAIPGARSPAKPVHPHGRGEHLARRSDMARVAGSSPRAWGTLAPVQSRQRGHRFIPTGVGNTCDFRLRSRASQVHPHGRGEHVQFRAHQPPGDGSSPRAWGTPERSE